jgi:hypothetical protein
MGQAVNITRTTFQSKDLAQAVNNAQGPYLQRLLEANPS